MKALHKTTAALEDNTAVVYVKNMVCRRFIIAVTEIFKEHGITPVNVELGKVVLPTSASRDKMTAIRHRLEDYGFEVIDDKRMRLLEQIRIGVIEYVHNPELQEQMNLSEYLQDKCRHEYSLLSKLFTELKGSSIERYYIAQRIELVKELLVYNELTVSEIAHRLHYSSVAHLSGQFRSVTGLSPTQFRQLQHHHLRPLDEI